VKEISKINGLFVWFVVTFYVVYSFSLNTAAAVFSPAIKTSLHTTSIQASIAVTMFIVGFAIMQIPAGYLLDKYRSKVVVSAGILILASGNLLTAFSTNLILFSLANLIQGIGASFAFVAAAVLIGQWFKPKFFPILFGLTQTISCILSGILHYIFAMALADTSWNTLYLYLSYYGFTLLFLSILFVKNPPDIKIDYTSHLRTSLRIVCSNAQLWLCTIAVSASFGVLLAYGSFWYMEIQQYYGVSQSDAMMIGACIFLGIGIGTPLLGFISNLLNSRTMVIHVSLTVGVMLLLGGIYLPKFNFESLALIKVISFLIGLSLSGSMLFFTILNEIFPPQVKGVALSVANTGVFLFYSLTLFMPYFLTTSKIFYTSLWVLPTSIMISILVLFFVKEPKRS
jgi:MFS family permease